MLIFIYDLYSLIENRDFGNNNGKQGHLEHHHSAAAGAAGNCGKESKYSDIQLGPYNHLLLHSEQHVYAIHFDQNRSVDNCHAPST